MMMTMQCTNSTRFSSSGFCGMPQLAAPPSIYRGVVRPLPPHTHLPPSPSCLATFLSPSRLFVGEALQQKFSTIYTTPSCCRSNLSLHHTCWSEEGGDVEVLHVCISRRHHHLWC